MYLTSVWPRLECLFLTSVGYTVKPHTREYFSRDERERESVSESQIEREREESSAEPQATPYLERPSVENGQMATA